MSTKGIKFTHWTSEERDIVVSYISERVGTVLDLTVIVGLFEKAQKDLIAPNRHKKMETISTIFTWLIPMLSKEIAQKQLTLHNLKKEVEDLKGLEQLYLLEINSLKQKLEIVVKPTITETMVTAIKNKAADVKIPFVQGKIAIVGLHSREISILQSKVKIEALYVPTNIRGQDLFTQVRDCEKVYVMKMYGDCGNSLKRIKQRVIQVNGDVNQLASLFK